MKTAFERAYESLNSQQKKAVDKIDGPLLVVAGPGTGKTQLLSTRVANILKSTDAMPNNILCLTYTNKAAVNMKERIIALAGQAGARVAASTFHSFAAELMNLYPDYFWNAAKLSVAPDALQLEVVESIVRELPLDNPLALKFAGQYTLLSDIQQAIKLAKEAGLTPEKLRSIIDYNLAYIDTIEEQLEQILAPALSFKKLEALQESVLSLPEQKIDKLLYPLASLFVVISESLDQAIKADKVIGKCVNTGKWKKRWVQNVAGRRGMFKERQRNLWWLELSRVYKKYRAALHQRSYYDYSDMLVEVIVQLEKKPEMLADVQERFSYVLLDEFQDTTPAQLRLAHLVADHYAAEGNPNLMAVGDDDQSIFKFNGAELNNMLRFKQTYPGATIIVLADNYRSSQAILDTAKSIIEQADSRLVKIDPSLKKKLVAKKPPKDKGGVKATAYSSSELQYSEVARDIARSWRPNRRVAVLARGHESLIKMAAILQKLKVPLRYEQASNILEHEIVDQVYLISKLLLAIGEGDRSTVSAQLHKIIRWPVWGIEPKTLWQLAAQNYPDKNWLKSLLAHKSPQLKTLGNWFIWLARQADVQPLAVSVEQIIGLRESEDFTSPVRDYFMGNASGDTNRYFHGLSAIQLLRAIVHEFGARSTSSGQAGGPTLAELVRFIEINKDNDKVVADESPFITGTHAVTLLSVHKAKGLEFDHVYVIDAVEDNWKPKSGGRKPPANLPLQPAGDDFDDYVRLMYVAATRAKSSLTVSSYYQDHSGKDVAVSSIAQSAMDIRKIDEEDRTKLITVLEENLRWPSLSGGQEKEILRARLEGYNLNLTHLQNFLDIERGGPQYFKERNLLRLPEVKTPFLSYGTAMHDALEAGQKLANQGRFSLAEIMDIFSQSLKAEQLPGVQYERYLSKGKQTLVKLFEVFNFQLPKGSASEQKMRDVQLGKALISGKLDRVDELEGKIRIIDYKTGTPLPSFTTKDKTKALKAHRHKMQLIFYALLLQAREGGISPKTEGQMVYVEAQNQKELVRSYESTPEDIKRLRRLVEAVWDKIINYELPDISVYSGDLDGMIAFEDDLIEGRT